jgi:hypothetical protein
MSNITIEEETLQKLEVLAGKSGYFVVSDYVNQALLEQIKKVEAEDFLEGKINEGIESGFIPFEESFLYKNFYLKDGLK